MEAVTALGVVSAVISFITFGKEVVSTTKAIYSSDEGIPLDKKHLEEIYSRLRAVSERLASPVPAPSQEPTSSLSSAEPAEYQRELQELSKLSNKDCQELLNALDDIKIQDGPRRLWKSVGAALRSKMGSKKLEALERNLQRTQGAMMLCISRILRLDIIPDFSMDTSH